MKLSLLTDDEKKYFERDRPEHVASISTTNNYNEMISLNIVSSTKNAPTKQKILILKNGDNLCLITIRIIYVISVHNRPIIYSALQNSNCQRI